MNVKITTFAVVLPICFAFIRFNNLIYETFAYIGCLLLCLVLSWQLASFIALRFINSQLPKVKPANKIVLITGCDSGFGYLTAKTLNKYGFKVFVGCLSTESDGAKKLQYELCETNNLVVVPMNVTKDEHIHNVYTQIEALVNDGYELWGVVNNAGIAVSSEVEWGTFDTHFRNIFDVNAFAVIKVSRKFLPLLRRSGGRIVNIASILSRFAVPLLSAYSMTKHAVAAFSDALRREMAKFRIRVINIEPNFYATNIIEGGSGIATKLWTETDASIRRDYGECYFNIISKNTKDGVRLVVRDKPEEVAEAVLESLIFSVTETKYVCCAPLFRPIISLASLLPLEFFDSFYYIYSVLFKIDKPIPDITE